MNLLRKIPEKSLLVLVGLFGCTASFAQPVCPSLNFKTFVQAFANDEQVQKTFMANPLRLVSVDADESGQLVQKISTINPQQEAVSIGFPVYGTGWADAVKIKKTGLHTYQVRKQLENDFYQYDFKKQNGCWYLIQFVNPSV